MPILLGLIKTNHTATSVTPNLENFTTYYEKLVKQLTDAIYIRQTLKDINKVKDHPAKRVRRKKEG